MKDKFTRKEVAARYGVSVRTVDNWIAGKRISYVKPSGRIYFTERQLQAFEQKFTIHAIV